MGFLKKKHVLFTCVFGVLIMVSASVVYNTCLSKQYKEVMTKSGLKVLFLEDNNLPYIQFALWFMKSGADYDYKNKSGLNAMTANLLDQGAGGLSSETIQENIDYYGASFAADTNRQFSKLVMSGLSWQAKSLWDIFLKITTEAHFEQKEFDLLKQQLLENRSQDLDDPESVVDEIWRRSLFKENSPVGQPDYGTITSLKNITLEDVKEFFSDHYLKGQPILTIVGQFDDQLKKEILDSFESRFSREQENKITTSTSKKPSFFKLLKKNDQVQSQILLGFQTLAFPKDNPRDSVALKLANTVLGGGGGLSNRLMIKLREEMGLTYGVWSALSLGRSYGLFQLGAATKTESTGLFLKETLILLKKFQEQGITQEELATVKLVLKSRYLNSIETPESRLDKIMYYHYYLGTKVSFVSDYSSIIDDISVEEINKVIAKYLTINNLSIVVYGDSSVREQLLQIKGLQPLEEISFEDYFAKELKKD